MNKKLTPIGKVILNAVIILAILTGCVLLTPNGFLHPIVLILGIIACCPLAKNLYHNAIIAQINNERKLKKYLPKIGCQVETIQRIEDSDTIRIIGKYEDETLIFDIEKNNPFLTIWDPAWLRVPVSDPNIPKFMEAINATNSQSGAVVVFSSPDKDGYRTIHTLYRTIIPNLYVSTFLNAILKHILNKKVDLRENFKDYSWLKQKLKKPMGFTMTEKKDAEQAAKQESTIAAQGESTVDDK